MSLHFIPHPSVSPPRQGQKPVLSGHTGPAHFPTQFLPIPGSYPPCSSLFRYSSRSSAGRAPQPRAWYSRNNSDTSISCLGELRASVPERRVDTITQGLLSQPSFHFLRNGLKETVPSISFSWQTLACLPLSGEPVLRPLPCKWDEGSSWALKRLDAMAMGTFVLWTGGGRRGT